MSHVKCCAKVKLDGCRLLGPDPGSSTSRTLFRLHLLFLDLAQECLMLLVFAKFQPPRRRESGPPRNTVANDCIHGFKRLISLTLLPVSLDFGLLICFARQSKQRKDEMVAISRGLHGFGSKSRLPKSVCHFSSESDASELRACLEKLSKQLSKGQLHI